MCVSFFTLEPVTLLTGPNKMLLKNLFRRNWLVTQSRQKDKAQSYHF